MSFTETTSDLLQGVAYASIYAVKMIAVRDLQQRLRETIEAAQREPVVITRHGRPVAIMEGVEGKSWPEVLRLVGGAPARRRRPRPGRRR